LPTIIDEDRLDETFAALANTTRRAILARLAEGTATVNELAEPFDLTLPAISKHIKVLERAGLIVRGREAQYRPCALDGKQLKEIATWAEQYRPIWEARFDRMDDYLTQLQSATKGRRTR
jgi:DNA-binding transcriptional ArsR family regulator